MNITNVQFASSANHIEVRCVIDGHREKFWVTKAHLRPGKDGRLYAHHGKLTLAVDMRKEPTEYALLLRKDSKKLILPQRLREDGTQGTRPTIIVPEEEKQRRAEQQEQERLKRIYEHVEGVLALCDVTADTWEETEKTIGLPDCNQNARSDWLDQLCEALELSKKRDALAIVLGCSKGR